MRPPAVFALAASFLLSSRLLADVARLPISADLDAEFARAADLLEEGKRTEAEAILDSVRRKAAVPAWDARAALLLAADDTRQGEFLSAASRLETAPASAIGLDAYRQLRRAEALELAGRADDALAPARRAFEAEGPFAFRVQASSILSRLLEKRREGLEAMKVLNRAATAATMPAEHAEVAIARIRLGLASGDMASVRSAARNLLLDAPTFDINKTTPEFARKAAAQAARSLSPAERGRRGRALVEAGDGRRGVKLLSQDRADDWPEGERGRNLLALARGHLGLKKPDLAEETAARVPDDGTLAAWEARLFRCDLVLARLRKGGRAPLSREDPRGTPVERALKSLTAANVPLPVRRAARERLLRFSIDASDFETAFAEARELKRDDPGAAEGFEPLWLLAWGRYRGGDFPGARARFEALAGLYRDVPRARRLSYWRARCLEAEGKAGEAGRILGELAAATPPDLYARFARARVEKPAPLERSPLKDPTTTSAAFARVDELLRLRMFEEASAESRRLLPSRGRDLRLAQSDFALGRFLPAASAIKRALPEIGTAEEGRVPDAWRRLYYPIEEGRFLADGAAEFSLDMAVLRGLVRQESVFDANARSRAGAMGLTQLMPATARSLARSVLRSRYRRAFLYDPGVNARLGAAYLRELLDRFDGSTLLALAAYNGGPTRIARERRENPDLPEDELFESIPLFETRDYVRRVILYAESYRELYP